MFDLIAFDADDTLWQNERLYLQGRQRLAEILAPYDISEDIEEKVEAVEVANLNSYGYGVMSFILSSIEAAVSLTSGRLTAADVNALVRLGKEMLSADVEVLDGVESVLVEMNERFPLMLITKGEPNHQYSKIERSGLKPFFRYVEVVHDKSSTVYAELLERVKVSPDRFLMVGNSIRSDVLPVLTLGGWAVHLSNNLTWSHEIADIPDNFEKRFYELSDIGHLPELISRLEEESLRNGPDPG